MQKKKKLQELIKMEKKLQTQYPADYNLLIAHDLWQAQYQILFMILLIEFIKLNVNTDTIIKKNVKFVELNTIILTDLLNTQTLKTI